MSFITDGATVLPAVKTDARGPTGAVDEWAAGDANKIRQALLDLRTAILQIQAAASVTGSVGPPVTPWPSLLAALEAAGIITDNTTP